MYGQAGWRATPGQPKLSWIDKYDTKQHMKGIAGSRNLSRRPDKRKKVKRGRAIEG